MRGLLRALLLVAGLLGAMVVLVVTGTAVTSAVVHETGIFGVAAVVAAVGLLGAPLLPTRSAAATATAALVVGGLLSKVTAEGVPAPAWLRIPFADLAEITGMESATGLASVMFRLLAEASGLYDVGRTAALAAEETERRWTPLFALLLSRTRILAIEVQVTTVGVVVPAGVGFAMWVGVVIGGAPLRFADALGGALEAARWPGQRSAPPSSHSAGCPAPWLPSVRSRSRAIARRRDRARQNRTLPGARTSHRSRTWRAYPAGPRTGSVSPRGPGSRPDWWPAGCSDSRAGT